MLFAILGVVIIVYLCVEFEFVRKLVAKLFFGTLAVALLIYGACAMQNAARAEELHEGFYYKIVFIDEVEEVELDRFDIEDGAVAKFLLYTDDLDHLWNYWDVVKEDEEDFVDYEFDRELSNIALRFIVDNQLVAKINKEERITRGRIVVLTMWECIPDDPFDEEVVDVYYTEFVTK